MNQPRPLWYWLATGLLLIAFVASFSGYVAARVVTHDLANPRYYARALAANGIYDRVYTDLLADPALRDVTARLLGNLQIDPSDSRAAYGHVVSTVRLVLPPAVLQHAVEGVIEELIGYLRGDRDRFEAALDLSEMVYDDRLDERIITAIQAVESELIAQTTLAGGLLPRDPDGQVALDVSDILVQLETYIAALADGQIGALPAQLAGVPTGQLSEAHRQQVVDVLLAPAGSAAPKQTRLQIEAALAGDDLPGAVVLASRELAGKRAEDVVATLRRELTDGQINGVMVLAELADRTITEVIGELNDLRDMVTFFRHDLSPVLTIAMIISLAGLVALQGRRVRRALRLAGIALVLAGVVVGVGWPLMSSILGVPYQSLTVDSSGQTLPPSLSLMLNDLLTSLLDDLRRAVLSRAAVPLLGGVILIGLSTIQTIAARLWRFLEPLHARPRPALVTLTAVIILAPVVTDWLIGEQREVEARVIVCNGHAELCDRPLDQVVFATTHNAMSISIYGWMWPEHDGTLTDQLRAGVRALMIDTHYGDTPEKIDDFLALVPGTARPVMEKIIQEADPQLQGEGLFLCHNICSLGGTPLVEGLIEIRAFMDKHPHEVIVLIFEDAITPADTARAFEESGLIATVYTHDPRRPWPTLDSLIASGERLVVFAETGGPPPGWYHHAWDYIQETPYAFGSSAEFTCLPNRGSLIRPFFLLNHWITWQSPDRADATVINAYDFLLERAQTCASQRGRTPNFIAVNFYSIGDLFAVVDTLNGVGK